MVTSRKLQSKIVNSSMTCVPQTGEAQGRKRGGGTVLRGSVIGGGCGAAEVAAVRATVTVAVTEGSSGRVILVLVGRGCNCEESGRW